jgi:hypothetical protein
MSFSVVLGTRIAITHQVKVREDKTMRNKFNFRAWTSLILVWTFVLLMISGTVLFVSPAGRISNWTNWRLGALTKAQWQSIHTLTAIAFLVGGLFHLLKFNWKVFWAYARKKGDRGWQYRKEMVASIALVVVVMTGTIIGIPPFSSVMTAGETVKNSWSTPDNEPPVPHLELLTLRQVSERLQVPPDVLLPRLSQRGFVLTGIEQSLADVAKRNGRSPQEVYRIAKEVTGNPTNLTTSSPGASGSHEETGAGSGLGLKTLSEIAPQLGLTTEEALGRLRAEKFEAEPQDTIRTIASRRNRKPFEVVELLKGTKQ